MVPRVRDSRACGTNEAAEEQVVRETTTPHECPVCHDTSGVEHTHEFVDPDYHDTPEAKIAAALETILENGSRFGNPRQQHWVLDQVVRCLTGDNYAAWCCLYNRNVRNESDPYPWEIDIRDNHDDQV